MRTMYFSGNEIKLENFEGINSFNELTFRILTNGLTILTGNQATLDTHFVVTHNNGHITNGALIKELRNINFPETSYFSKLPNMFIQNEDIRYRLEKAKKESES